MSLGPNHPKRRGPAIPAAIQRDVKFESHLECSICGSKDNGELAHIDPAANTSNNSPDNLLLLCPNHHTNYDLGHKPSNVSRDLVLAAKAMKRASRRRMLRYEGNAFQALRAVLQAIEKIDQRLTAAADEQAVVTYST